MISNTPFDPIEYMAEMDSQKAKLDAMNVEQLVAYIKEKCSNVPFYASLIMGEHFLSVSGQVINALSENGYTAKVKLDELLTCPITGRFNMLYVNKILNEEEKLLYQEYRKF